MTPDTHDLPTLERERPGLAPVSGGVCHQLQAPPRRVGLRPRCMFGTGMPEAPINKNGHAPSAKDDVGPDPTTAGVDSLMQTVTQPALM